MAYRFSQKVWQHTYLLRPHTYITEHVPDTVAMSSQHTATPLRTQYYTSTHLSLHHCLSTLHAYTILYEYTLIPLTDLATYYASTPHRDHTSIVILLMSNQLALIISTYYSTVNVAHDVITRYIVISLATHTVTHLLLLLCCLLFFSFVTTPLTSLFCLTTTSS